MTATAAEQVIAAARTLLGERLSTAAALREQHARGEDTTTPTLPDAVAFPESTEEVVALVKLCAQHSLPIVPFGAGTSLEGHVNPVRAGLTVDLSRMNRIIEVSAADMDCLIEPGVTRQQLNEYLRDQGLFFPVDPGSICTIGGMCATRASGTNAVRYGTIKENVLSLEVVLADGRVITTGSRARKASNGYDLTRLMIGSEGTLGIITKIRLRLHGIPEAMSAAVCSFPTLKGAVDTAIATLQCGIPVARMELVDEVQMAACISYSKLEGYAATPHLFFEFHGTEASTQEQAEMVEAIAKDNGAGGFQWASDATARNQLWQARHNAYYAAIALQKGSRSFTTDVCVPISRLDEALLGAKQDIEASGLTAPMCGHVGDGNFHCCIIVDPNDKVAMEKAWALDKKIVHRALDLGGTCSGEHGIGLGKREFLEIEHGPEGLAVMRSIKQTLDPKGILNPGKMFRN